MPWNLEVRRGTSIPWDAVGARVLSLPLLSPSPDVQTTAQLPVPCPPHRLASQALLRLPCSGQGAEAGTAHGSGLTFARLPVGLQGESHGAAAPHARGRVLARPVAASIVDGTCLCGGKETELLRLLGQKPPPLPTQGGSPETGDLSSSPALRPSSCGASLSLTLPICEMGEWHPLRGLLVNTHHNDGGRGDVCKLQRVGLGKGIANRVPLLLRASADGPGWYLTPGQVPKAWPCLAPAPSPGCHSLGLPHAPSTLACGPEPGGGLQSAHHPSPQ